MTFSINGQTMKIKLIRRHLSDTGHLGSPGVWQSIPTPPPCTGRGKFWLDRLLGWDFLKTQAHSINESFMKIPRGKLHWGWSWEVCRSRAQALPLLFNCKSTAGRDGTSQAATLLLEQEEGFFFPGNSPTNERQSRPSPWEATVLGTPSLLGVD